MIQIVKNKPLTSRVKISEYEFVKPKYLMPVGSFELIEAKVKCSTMVWNIEGETVSYNQIKKCYELHRKVKDDKIRLTT